MSPDDRSVFAHHDQIRSARAGSYLMAAEPFTALDYIEGGEVVVPEGKTLRVAKFGEMMICEMPNDGRMMMIGISPVLYHHLERCPAQTQKA